MASGKRKLTLYTNGEKVREVPIQGKKKEEEDEVQHLINFLLKKIDDYLKEPIDIDAMIEEARERIRIRNSAS